MEDFKSPREDGVGEEWQDVRWKDAQSGTDSEEEEAEAAPSFPSLEANVLHAARHGDSQRLTTLLEDRKTGTLQFDINCKGNEKSNRGWTPLHLAAYFGHLEVVRLLLEHGADVDAVNTQGDTPLHRAAFTGREAVLTLLVQFGADVLAVNSEGHTPKQMAKSQDVLRLLKAAESTQSNKVQEEFLEAAAAGNVNVMVELLKSSKTPSINCTDRYGNTALHIAALRGQKEVVVYLLQNGIDTTIKNKNGQTAVQMTQSTQMQQLLGVQPVKSIQRQPRHFEGALLKKSRVFGFKALWGVLERGVLSYFQNRGDASTGVKRKGMKYLDEARIVTKEETPNVIQLAFSDGTVHTLSFEMGNAVHIARQKWLNALKEHIAFSTHYTHQGEERNEYEKEMVPLGTMQETLQTSQAHQRHLEESVSLLTSAVEKMSSEQPKDTKELGVFSVIWDHIEEIRGSSRDMVTSLSHCMTLFSQQEEVRETQLREERERSRILQESLHALALEHQELERSLASSRRARPRIYDTDNDEFYDCDDDEEYASAAKDGATEAEYFESFLDNFDVGEAVQANKEEAAPPASNSTSDTARRECLPRPMFSRADFSIWSILKQCIGKELSKITMPVVFNEPLSFIQRISEYMEYSYLLDKASQCQDPVERMQYVAAFAVSATSSNWERIGKPFNPLLGETYELERPELGFRLVGEQVSHHPPVSALHVESPNYRFHGSIHPKLKFWGKSVEVNPKGLITLELLKHNEVYTWQNVNCCVHNVIVGKLWMESYGTMEVVNQKTRHKAVLTFKQGSWFGKELHKVEGFIYNPEKRKVRAIYGNWILGLFTADAEVYEENIKSSTPAASPAHHSHPKSKNNGATDGAEDDVGDDIPSKSMSSYDLHLPGQATIWKAYPRPDTSPQYFNFTNFAMSLNELTGDIRDKIAPTDSRLRPDIRLLEEGNIDLAAEEKNRLEEKQRAARKDRKKHKDEWTPVWFQWRTSPSTGKDDWVFNGDYWKRDWTKCPDIF